MKSFFTLFLFLIVTSSLVAGNENKNSANIQLQIKGISNEYVKLLAFLGEQQYIADSAWTDANGKAVFKNDTAYQAGMYFILFPDFISFTGI